MQTIATTGMPPNDSPRATIGGISYDVEHDLLSEYMLSKENVNLVQALQVIGAAENRNTYMIFQIWAAMTASNFLRRGHPTWTAEQWISKIPQAEAPETIALMMNCIRLAVVKRWPALNQKAETAQATATDRPQ